MEEFKRQFILLGILILTLFVLVVVYKSDSFWRLAKKLPLTINNRHCISLYSGLCLSEDAGLRLTYNEASAYCSKRGMRLPTRDDAWSVWISSENCHRVFAMNMNVPKSKQAFIDNCKIPDECVAAASRVSNYCIKSPKIKFPLASQYDNGNFWLSDKFAIGEHYSINYSTGKIDRYSDDTKTLGVRCISYENLNK